IADPSSVLDGAIVVNSRLRDVTARAGGVVLECDCSQLAVDGPAGFAYRLTGDARVGGDEIVAEIGLPPDLTRLSYVGTHTIVDDQAYRTRLGTNAISFEEAATMAELLDPLDLLDHWTAVGR